MLSHSQIEAAHEVNIVALIAQSVKLTRKGTSWWGLCPFHAEKSPSFKVDQQRGRYKCFGCGASGDAVDWLRETERLTFPAAVEALAGRDLQKCERSAQDRHDHKADAGRIKEVREIWRRAQPISNTRAARYLEARGIKDLTNPSLKFLPAHEYAPGVWLPAMVSGLLSPDRTLSAVQMTFLHPRESRKACVATPRRSLGPMGTGAVRLGPASDVLGIAEGVEDALSATQLTGITCWAALGAQRLHQIAIPDGVKELHIFADNDDAGRTAAERTAAQHRDRLTVEIRLPPTGKDWNDALKAQKGK